MAPAGATGPADRMEAPRCAGPGPLGPGPVSAPECCRRWPRYHDGPPLGAAREPPTRSAGLSGGWEHRRVYPGPPHTPGGGLDESIALGAREPGARLHGHPLPGRPGAPGAWPAAACCAIAPSRPPTLRARLADRRATASRRNGAEGLRRDDAAVQAALTLAGSTGPVEGQLKRLKLIKRSGYGRMQLDLFRQ